MIKIDNIKANYDFEGEYGAFKVYGTCVYTDTKLLELNASIDIIKDPIEESLIQTGHFSYSSYIDDKVSFTYSINKEYSKSFANIMFTIVDELEAAYLNK